MGERRCISAEPAKIRKTPHDYNVQLLYLVIIDGVVSNEERRFLHEVGLKLAVKPALTNDLLFAMEEHIGKELPDGLLNSIIAKYLN